MPLTLLTVVFLINSHVFAENLPQKASEFNGEYSYKQNHFLTSENRTVKDVENVLKINSSSDTEAQVLIETFNQNLHSCQLVGKATLEKGKLVFKSQISPQLNRGKQAQCVLKISKIKTADQQIVIKIDDTEGLCRLQFCGFQAELNGEFKSKSPVEVQDKN